MLGPITPRRLDQAMGVSLANLVPADNVYHHLEAKLGLGFVRDWTGEPYAERSQPAIDPVIHAASSSLVQVSRYRLGRAQQGGQRDLLIALERTQSIGSRRLDRVGAVLLRCFHGHPAPLGPSLRPCSSYDAGTRLLHMSLDSSRLFDHHGHHHP
jgi:hypothetical protein